MYFVEVLARRKVIIVFCCLRIESGKDGLARMYVARALVYLFHYLRACNYINMNELELDTDEDTNLPRFLAEIEKLYFMKMLVSIAQLLNLLDSEFDGIGFI